MPVTKPPLCGTDRDAAADDADRLRFDDDDDNVVLLDNGAGFDVDRVGLFRVLKRVSSEISRQTKLLQNLIYLFETCCKQSLNRRKPLKC